MMEKDFCLEDYWGYFKDLNNQNDMLGVENFEDALREVIRILKGRTFYASTNDHKPINPDVKQGGDEVVWIEDVSNFIGFAKGGLDE